MADINTTIKVESDGTKRETVWHDDGNGKYLQSVHVEGINLEGATLEVNEATLDSIKTATEAAQAATGTTTDAAVSTDTTGTISGKLRGLVKILADVWDSVAHGLKTQQAPLAYKVTVSGSITYIAEAVPGTAQAAAAWRVKKVDETSGVVVTWADGNTNFDNDATDLAALSYS